MRPSRRSRRVAVAAAVLAIGIASLALARARQGGAGHAMQAQAQTQACDLHGVQHVIHLQFDNLHFTRDNPNVPSDLEQMPHLLDFIEQNGVLLSNHHTPLIAHTATDLLTAITGLYGDRSGVPIANSFGYFDSNGTPAFASAFGYWTAPVSARDPAYNLLTAPDTNTPAPWVPFTRAGCDVGGVGATNMELENAKGDVAAVFGSDSPQANEAGADSAKAAADLIGIAVHCAPGSALCSPGNGGVPDLLPSEPGGYAGFNALFGHASVAPQISPGGPLIDLNGKPIGDGRGNAGFPGFDAMTPAVSLAYVAAMQEHGVPVTYAYLSDAHDNHGGTGTFGPGEAGYVAQLQAYDAAFAAFFTRLAGDGITAANTVFVVTADEGDRFAGAQATGCDGVTTACTYSHDPANPTLGEVAVNLPGLLATQQALTVPFTLRVDSAPTFYLAGMPPQDGETVRALERAAGATHLTDPYSGNDVPLADALADQAEMSLLHMVTADPARTPTLTLFGRNDLWLQTGPPTCDRPCVAVNPGSAWIHGTIDPAITTTWLGLVGPGVLHLGVGVNDAVWSDHTDVRPTLLVLLGLHDDYVSDGRALVEVLDSTVGPAGDEQRVRFLALAGMYKRINAPLGELARLTLRLSTTALASSAPDDGAYAGLESQLATIAARRNTLAGAMAALLDQATFAGGSLDAATVDSLTAQGSTLLTDASALTKQ
ncbi:MAG: hypothetical protein ACYDCQ_11000 [Dehalococcoidia bacterium]